MCYTPLTFLHSNMHNPNQTICAILILTYLHHNMHNSNQTICALLKLTWLDPNMANRSQAVCAMLNLTYLYHNMINVIQTIHTMLKWAVYILKYLIPIRPCVLWLTSLKSLKSLILSERMCCAEIDLPTSKHMPILTITYLLKLTCYILICLMTPGLYVLCWTWPACILIGLIADVKFQCQPRTLR